MSFWSIKLCHQLSKISSRVQYGPVVVFEKILATNVSKLSSKIYRCKFRKRCQSVTYLCNSISYFFQKFPRHLIWEQSVAVYVEIDNVEVVFIL